MPSDFIAQKQMAHENTQKRNRKTLLDAAERKTTENKYIPRLSVSAL